MQASAWLNLVLVLQEVQSLRERIAQAGVNVLMSQQSGGNAYLDALDSSDTRLQVGLAC